MFKNAGKKLRILVQISFFIFASADIILPLSIYNTRPFDEMTCFIVILIALLITYLFHLFFYAHAELMENVYDIKSGMKCDSTLRGGERNVNDTFNDEKESYYEDNPELERATLEEIKRAKKEQIERDNRYNKK